MNCLRYLLPIFLAGCLLGCGDAGPKVYSVKGKVTINGQAPKGVQVNFIPVAQDGVTGSSAVAADGAYSLLSGTENRPGLPAGKYKVVLVQTGPSGNDAKAAYTSGVPTPGGGVPGVTAPSFPAEYLKADTSPKEVEVKPQPNVIDIAI